MFPKRLIALTLFAALAVMPTCVLRAQWVQTNGPSGGEITALSSIGTIIFAGTTSNGIFRSTNNGTNWIAVNSGLRDTGISTLVVIGTNLFAGTYFGHVFLSNDSGTHWSATNLVNSYVTALAASGMSLFVATDDSVFVSSDFGTSWRGVSSGLPRIYVYEFAVNGTNIFAATPGGVFVSTNNGSSWSVTGLLADVRSLLVAGSNIFAATIYDGVYLSTDSGKTWSVANSGLPSDTAVNIFARIGTNLFAGTNGSGIFISTNDGLEWSRTGLSNEHIEALHESGSTLFSGTTSDGIFLSTNGGTSWDAVNTGLPNSEVYALGVIDTSILAQTGGGLFLSSDTGLNWSSDYSFAFGVNINAIAAVRIGSLTDLFLGVDGGVWKSTDDGMSWQENGDLANLNVQALAFSGYYLLAGTDSGGVYISADYGNGWFSSGSLIDTSITAIAVIGLNVFVGIQGHGVLFSTDTGATWEVVNTGLTDTDVNALLAVGTNLFAGTEHGGVFLSINNGTSWKAVNSGLMDTDVKTLALSGSILLAGTYGGGVWRRPLSDFGISAVSEAPATKRQLQTYPNPFTQSTQITFTSASAGYADISIVNLRGEQVARIFSGELGAGEHNFTFSNTTGLPDGMYDCLVRMNGRVETLPMVLVH